MTPLEITVGILVCLGGIGGFYKFLDSRMNKYIADTEGKVAEKIEANEEKIKENKIQVDKELHDIRERTEKAVEHGREIELNYNKKFQDTNTNITKTREEMITGFGRLEGLILGIKTSLDLKKES